MKTRIQKTFKNDLPTIYLLPTPIGNLGDISKNVLEYFNSVGVLYCEDTRTTKNLISNIDNTIKVKTKSFHKFNENERKNELLEDLFLYKKIGICSDAGMPGICDPGISVLNSILENNSDKLNLTIISPNCAFIGSLLISGLYFNTFTFIGFLPKKDNLIESTIKNFAIKNNNIVFYESVHRIQKTLYILKSFIDESVLISVVRELSKLNEEIVTGTITDVSDYFNSNLAVIKGEFCVILDQNIIFKKSENNDSDLSLNEKIEQLINSGISLNDAVKEIAKKEKIKKSSLYNDFIKNSKK